MIAFPTLWQTLRCLLAGAALSGCVLHAKTPLFSDADAVPLLGSHAITLSVFERKAGGWVASDEPTVTAVPEGNHYTVPDAAAPNDPALADRYAFIPLDPGHYVVQATAGGAADYAIATWDGQTLLVSGLDCAALKTSLKTNAIVGFVDDACTLRPSTTPTKALFAQLLLATPAPTLRLIRQ